MTVTLSLAGCGPPTTGGATAPSSVPATPHAGDPAPLDELVIVDLAVDRRLENELTPDEAAAQRRRIAGASDAVVAALGEHGRVRRRLDATAQLSLAVDEEGLRILRQHPQVSDVHEDTADPPD